MIYFCIATVSCYSCNTAVSSKSSVADFDIPAFFQSEIDKLQTLNPIITKTVSNEKSSESKELKIASWQKELAQFSSVDINATGSIDFTKETKGDTLVYTTPTPAKNEVTVKVIFENESPSEINIHKKTQNLLFVNEESLNYTVGKSYLIDKKQYVKGMGKNHYAIKGIFHL